MIRHARRPLVGLLTAALVLSSTAAPAVAATGDTTLVSRHSDGTIGNGRSDLSATASAAAHGSVSADGRFIAFESAASNLVSGDTNTFRDVFVHDRQTGATTRVSVRSDGAQANGTSRAPAISADGRYVAFDSDATNLAGTDTGLADVFVHDRATGMTERITKPDPLLGQRLSRFATISGDGRYVAFESDAVFVPGDTNGKIDVFVFDRQALTMERVSVASDETEANGHSIQAALSADGRYVAFSSDASNLAAADPTPGIDVFVRDRQAGTTELISVATDGGSGNGISEHPALSADGRFVAFESGATNLTATDTNGIQDDVYLRDRNSRTTERVSVKSDGAQVPGTSHRPSVSADGTLIVFTSTAQLGPGDLGTSNDAYLRNRSSGETRQINVKNDGTPDNGDSLNVAISSNGAIAAFDSNASDLAAGDTNATMDVFVHEIAVVRAATTTTVASSANPSMAGQSVTLTATVAPVAPATGVPSGVVTFREGLNILGSAPLAAGSASVATGPLAAGSYAITAEYEGDAAFAGSVSATLTQLVTAATVVVNVAETIGVSDGPALRLALRIDISETIGVSDGPQVRVPVTISVSETIAVGDAVTARLPVVIAVQETVSVADAPALRLSVVITVSELIGVSDSAALRLPVTITITEQVTVGDGVRVLPPVVITIAEAVTASDGPRVLDTVPGSDVSVPARDPLTGASVRVTFATVTSAGNTTLATSATGEPPPAGFALGLPPRYYDVSTTAGFTPPVSVCIELSGIAFSGPPRIFHLEDGVWVDRTSSFDPASNTICASVMSLSPFIVVVDVEPPTIAAPANQTVATDPGQCGAVVSYAPPTATDNVGVVSIVSSPSSGSTFPMGATTVTHRAADAAGNSATATHTVTVNDTQPPSISVPANITVGTEPGQASAVVTYSVTATDNCPGVTATASPSSGSAFPVGTTTVTGTATDSSGNTANASFSITVQDREPPTITCPANVVVEAPAGQTSVVASYAAPTANDNVGVASLTTSPPSGSAFPAGTTTVTATATDVAGNSATCSFTVKVNLTLAIDIKPGSFPNSINPGSRGSIPVAILALGAFDPLTLDRASLRFGPTGGEATPSRCAAEDVNGDGRLDLVCHFSTQASAFQAGDTVGRLRGQTVAGVNASGSDSVQIVPP